MTKYYINEVEVVNFNSAKWEMANALQKKLYAIKKNSTDKKSAEYKFYSGLMKANYINYVEQYNTYPFYLLSELVRLKALFEVDIADMKHIFLLSKQIKKDDVSIENTDPIAVMKEFGIVE